MDKPLALVVHFDRPAGRADEAAALREAIHEYFGQRVFASRRKLRELFRRGRISLAIALAFLTASIAVGDVVAGYLGEGRLGGVIREGFLIGGWVAMWRPLEVFLYDWWPIRAEGRLLQRLSTMPVRIEYKETAPADAWRSDWPEVTAAEGSRVAAFSLPQDRAFLMPQEEFCTGKWQFVEISANGDPGGVSEERTTINDHDCRGKGIRHAVGRSLFSRRRYLHPSLERVVHGLESLPRDRVKALAQHWHQEASESFALDELRAAAPVQRLDLKEVLSVENTRKHDAPQPSQLLVRHGTKDARAECHAHTAGLLNRYL